MPASKWPALLALLLVTVVAVACGGGDDNKAPGDGDISKVADNFAKAKSFKATISGGPGSLQAIVEYLQPNSIRVTVGSGGQEQQIVCIDSDFYVKQGSGQWQKVPQGGGSAPSCRANLGPADPKFLGDSIKAATSDQALNKGGQDRVNGKQCQIYMQLLPNAGSTELCIADGLPQRIVTKGAGPQGVTITFTDYDKNVDIKAPI